MILPARPLARLALSPMRSVLARHTSRCLRMQHPSASLRIFSEHSIKSLERAVFSTSTRRRQDEPVTTQLRAKLDSELSLEKQMRDPDSLPSHLKEFLESSEFELHDTPGNEEVVMTRKYGDETIRVTFSIDDLNNPDEDPDQIQQDRALMDEMDEGGMANDDQSGNGANGGAINRPGPPGAKVQVAPEDSIAPSDRPELNGEDADMEANQAPTFTSHCYITVEKPHKGALQIEVIAQDGFMVIENVYFYKDAKLVDPKSRQDEDAVRDLYTGPPFGNLDEDLQLLFERYLDERGINSTLALFVPEYIDFKEQREYTNWLSGVKNFFE